MDMLEIVHLYMFLTFSIGITHSYIIFISKKCYNYSNIFWSGYDIDQRGVSVKIFTLYY